MSMPRSALGARPSQEFNRIDLHLIMLAIRNSFVHTFRNCGADLSGVSLPDAPILRSS
jgi:hypothetical protein